MPLPLLTLCLSLSFTPDDGFVVAPYLQFGPVAPTPGDLSMEVRWAAPDSAGSWSVDVRTGEGPWRAGGVGKPTHVALKGAHEQWVYAASLDGLLPGIPFTYRVMKDGRQAFKATGRALSESPSKLHAVIFGDCARDTPEQRRIAHLASTLSPDFVLITGDIVYDRGLVHEYLHHFFPVYNAPAASPEVGAPLLRSTPFIGACGNHDTSGWNVDEFTDSGAYFWYWSHPRNGPTSVGAADRGPNYRGAPANVHPVLDAAGDALANSRNFSFDAGDVHWTVLDSNLYVNWKDPAMQAWLAADLAKASKATWRFVAFHHPPFHSSETHQDDQWMRRLAPIFEAGKVDVVFSGHVHNYQRSKPLTFAPGPEVKPEPGKPAKTAVEGQIAIDETFDGVQYTMPNGVIYIVTGAGGAPLYVEKSGEDRFALEPFTESYESSVHSLTVLDVDGPRATITQRSVNGEIIDRCVLTK
jgi:3',5'-cyclic AMP phosphodiesterase CpdA